MPKFQIKQLPNKPIRYNFSVPLDHDLQMWIRLLAYKNHVTITEATNQIVRFAMHNS